MRDGSEAGVRCVVLGWERSGNLWAGLGGSRWEKGVDCNDWDGWLCVWKRGRDGRWYSRTIEKKGLEKGGGLVRVYRLVWWVMNGTHRRRCFLRCYLLTRG
jgi:hypothetical protein